MERPARHCCAPPAIAAPASPRHTVCSGAVEGGGGGARPGGEDGGSGAGPGRVGGTGGRGMAAAWWQRGREGGAAGGRAGESGPAGDAGGFQHLVSAMPHGGGDAAALKLGFLVSELTRFFAPRRPGPGPGPPRPSHPHALSALLSALL